MQLAMGEIKRMTLEEKRELAGALKSAIAEDLAASRGEPDRCPRCGCYHPCRRILHGALRRRLLLRLAHLRGHDGGHVVLAERLVGVVQDDLAFARVLDDGGLAVVAHGSLGHAPGPVYPRSSGVVLAFATRFDADLAGKIYVGCGKDAFFLIVVGVPHAHGQLP